MRRRPSRYTAVIAALLAMLAAGSNRGDAGEPEESASPSPTPTADASPSPEPTEGPTQQAGEAPPELHLVGDDYERLARSHVAFRTWLFRNPDPELLDEIVHPECECYVEKELLASYVERDLHWTGNDQGIVVHDVKVVDDLARNLVHLQVVLERPAPGELVDADGNVHNRVEPRAPWVEDLVFIREDAESPWQLRDFTDRGPVEGASDG